MPTFSLCSDFIDSKIFGVQSMINGVDYDIDTQKPACIKVSETD
jgi:hypothetical protein